MRKSKRKGTLRGICLALALGAAPSLQGCGPHARIPELPAHVPGAVDSTDPGAFLARTLAPVLYVQRDEWFRLSRVVAVLHPTRPIIAYHLLWRDDVNGAWIPFTKPTDEEVVWVGYDSTRAPTDLWTYWHGTILHADWRGHGTVAVDVQWGKHGSLPHGVRLGDLPFPKKLPFFWLSTYIGLPDIWLGDTERHGPLCFCHGYRRYADFSRVLVLGSTLDAIVRAADPRAALHAVFGEVYSNKIWWPD